MMQVSLRIGTEMKNDLVLNVFLYDEKCIKRAIVDYRSLALIRYKKKDDYFLISFHACRYNKDATINEFCNYLIDMQNATEIV